MNAAIVAKKISKTYKLTSPGLRSLSAQLNAYVMNPLLLLRRNSVTNMVFFALKNVSFSIQTGETIGILGPNGAGKSTLLKLIAGITRPSSGSLLISATVGSLLEAGTGFHPDLTGRENMYLSAAILGIDKKRVEQRFKQIVSFAGVGEFLDMPVKHYSSGMYIRLAVATALELNPDILLIDEVLSVGDIQFQQKTFERLELIATNPHKTVLLVSHNLNILRRLCSRGLYFDHGTLVFDGPIDRCISKYLKQYSSLSLHFKAKVSSHDPLCITSVQLKPVKTPVTTGTKIIIHLKFRVAKPLIGVVFGVFIHTIDDTRIFECRSIDSLKPLSFKPGHYTIECAITNQLLPGRYTIGVGARCGIHTHLTYIPHAYQFTVHAPFYKYSPWLSQLSGIFTSDSLWTEPTK